MNVTIKRAPMPYGISAFGCRFLNQPQTRGCNYKKEEPQHANCVSRLSTGTGVHNGTRLFLIIVNWY